MRGLRIIGYNCIVKMSCTIDKLKINELFKRIKENELSKELSKS